MVVTRHDKRLYLTAILLVGILLLATALHRATRSAEGSSASSEPEQPEARPRPGRTIELAGEQWTLVLEWTFADGLYPAGWSWGSWRLENGLLVGSDPDSTISAAVYVLPFVHGPDFLMETTFRMRSLHGATHTETQLLTRDGRALRFESGLALVTGTDRVRVRCFAAGEDRLYGSVPTGHQTTYGTWYVARYLLREGRVVVFINDEEMFDSATDKSAWASPRRLEDAATLFPTEVFREPHLAVRNGEAAFRSVRIWVPTAVEESRMKSDSGTTPKGAGSRG